MFLGQGGDGGGGVKMTLFLGKKNDGKKALQKGNTKTNGEKIKLEFLLVGGTLFFGGRGVTLYISCILPRMEMMQSITSF